MTRPLPAWLHPRDPAPDAPRCGVCGALAKVLHVDLDQQPAVVEFGCRGGCDVRWSVEAGEDDPGGGSAS